MRKSVLMFALFLIVAGNASAQQKIYSREGSVRATTSLTTGQIARALDSSYVGLSAPSDDVLLVGNGSTWQDKSLTDCDDTGGNHLNYDTTTNVFSCGTSGGGGGSGDVTDVGPGCATGACWKDGTATSGSSLLIWEGTTADTAEFTITVPTDPSADITWTVPNSAASITFPSGTRTLATLDGTETLTNKSLDASSIASGTLGASRGGTGIGSYVQGDLITATGASTLTTIAKSTTATRYLANTGASNYAQWDQVNLTNGVTGTLPAGNGGTGQTATTDDSLLVANGTTFQLKTLTDCDDTSGQHLNYDTTTNAFSCGTTSSGGGGGGAPTAAQYVTLALDGTLSAERVLTAGSQIDISDTGANGTAVIDWDSTELGTTTFGSGSGIAWTFDASAGTDPAITFGNGTVNVSAGALQQGGSTVVDVGDTGTVTGTMILDNTVNASDIDETTNYTWTGTHDFSGGLATLPSRLSACTSVVTNGQVCWDSDDFVASIGNGTGRAVLVDTGRTISTTSPLSGGGDLSANRTLSITANGINATQIDETANYAWSGLNTQTSGSLNFGNAAGALILPNNTTGVCDTATTEGQICWSTSDLLKVGTSSGVKTMVDTDSNQTLTTKTLTSPTINTPSIATATITGATTATYTDSSTSGLPAMSTWTQTMAPGSASTSLNLGNAFLSDYNTTTNSTSALLVGVYAKSVASNTGDIGSLAALYAQVGTTNAGATCTNCYGLYVADSSATGTNTGDYAIYTAGGEQTRLGGKLGVGAVDPDATLRVSTATIGNEVAKFESVATNDDPNLRIFQSRSTAAASGTTNIDLNLTSAAPTTAPCPSSSVCVVEARTVCHCTSGTSCTAHDGGGNVSTMTVKNNGGTISLLGAVTTQMASQIGASSLTSLTLSVSSPSARMAVVVPANFNHTCHVTWLVQNVGT